MEKFFMVWKEGTPSPVKRHPNHSSAFKEAKRIARLHPGKKVYVLEAIDCRWVEEQPLTYKIL